MAIGVGCTGVAVASICGRVVAVDGGSVAVISGAVVRRGWGEAVGVGFEQAVMTAIRNRSFRCLRMIFVPLFYAADSGDGFYFNPLEKK